MKSTLVALTILLSAACSLSAMVGQTFTQLTAQFGKPEEFNRAQRFAIWKFPDRGFELRARFDKRGECGQEIYKSLFKNGAVALSLAQLETAIAVQIPRAKYREQSSTDDSSFAGFEVYGTESIAERVSTVTPKGRILVSLVSGSDNPSKLYAPIISIALENFVREYARGN